MDRVKIRAEEALRDRVEALFFEDKNRILNRVVARVTENLENGKKQRTRPLEVELESEKAVAFDRACYFNGRMKLILVDRYLQEELERL